MSDRVLVACDACARSTSGRCGVHASIGVVVPPFGSPIGAPGSGVPLRTLPGPDWQAECGAAREDRDRLAREVAQLEREVEALRAAADAPPYVDCICPGCPRKVPHAWASGMCEPCAVEDCEHTDGARAVAVERDGLQAELDRMQATTRSGYERWKIRVDDSVAERDQARAALVDSLDALDRLRAVLAEAEGLACFLFDRRTNGRGWEWATREQVISGEHPDGRAWMEHAEACLAYLRARAAAPTGQAGGAQSGSVGPPAGLSPLGAAVWRARGGPPPPHLGAGATAGYVSPAYAGVEAPGPEGGRPRYQGLCCETCGAMGPCDCCEATS